MQPLSACVIRPLVVSTNMPQQWPSASQSSCVQDVRSLGGVGAVRTLLPAPEQLRELSPLRAAHGDGSPIRWWQPGHNSRVLEPHEEHRALEETFRAFCGQRVWLDGMGFAKLCRDCHLSDRRFTIQDSDVVFANVMPSGQRRMEFAQFDAALRAIAEKKGVEHSVVRKAVAMVKGPTLVGTKAEAVRFHDDRVQAPQPVYAAQNLSPRPAPAQQLIMPELPRTWLTQSSSAVLLKTASQVGVVDPSSPSSPRMPLASYTAQTAVLAWPEAGGSISDSIECTFRAFSGGHPELDGRSFSKLCRDCHLIDGRLTVTDADLIFARVVPSGQRRIDMPLFETALKLIGEKKCVDEIVVRRAVASSSGPRLYATKAEAVRFHDDKSTYTGTCFYGRSGV